MAFTALELARERFSYVTVDHVQSGLSHDIDLRETQHKLVFHRHHPRRHPRKKSGPFGETLK